MDCLTTAVESFIVNHDIDPMYMKCICHYLKDSNYTIYTRIKPLYISKKIKVQLIQDVADIEPNTIIGIYIKPNEYLNVFGYHYFYVSDDHIISSWYTTTNISKEEYDKLQYKERSLSETSIENGNIELTTLDMNVWNKLWNLIQNDKDDIGNDMYQLFGGIKPAQLTLKKSENKILMYMFNVA